MLVTEQGMILSEARTHSQEKAIDILINNKKSRGSDSDQNMLLRPSNM